MNPLFSCLSALDQALARCHRRWALIGGLAVSVFVEPRLTRDVDLVVDVSTDGEAESLVRELQTQGFHVATLIEQEACHRLATVRLIPPSLSDGEGPVVDLLFASSGIEQEIVREAIRCPLDQGLSLPVARPGHLVALKVLSRDDRTRPQDAVDLARLLPALDEAEVSRARQAVGLIVERGFHRGRDLPRLLEDEIRAFRP